MKIIEKTAKCDSTTLTTNQGFENGKESKRDLGGKTCNHSGETPQEKH